MTLTSTARPWAAALRIAVVVLGQCALTTTLSAQETTLPTVVVTAARLAQSVNDTLPSTSVITRADIVASQAPDVLTLLRLQQGVEVAQNGGVGGVASVFMRGTNSSHVLLLVDGMRMNAVASGAPAWSQLMLDDVERIEIVRGNVSALYGSEAIGGVVQIFTRSGGKARGASAMLQVGSERTRAASVAASTEFGTEGAKTRAGISASYRSVLGFSSVDPSVALAANPDKDGYRNQTVSASVTQHIGAHEIGLTARSSRGWRDFDDPTDYSFFGPPYNGSVQTHKEYATLENAMLHGRFRLGDIWESTLQIGQMRDMSDNTSSYPASFVTGRTLNRTRQFSWLNNFDTSAHSTFTAGLEHLDQDGSGSAFAGSFVRHVDSAMAGYSGTFGKHQMQLNLRHDRYSDFGAATTALAAYSYRVATDWKMLGQVSNAFRAPSFNDLYFPGFGNPALLPERARSVEWGVQYARGRDFLRAALYRNRISDLIVFDPFIAIANNVAAARITGLELSGKTTLASWDLSANLTLQRPIDAQTGQRLLRRAAHNLNLGAAHNWERWRFLAELQRAGDRFDSDINTFARVSLAPFTLTNFSLATALNKNLDLTLALRNAFAAHYRLVDGYNNPGRVVLVTVSAKM